MTVRIVDINGAELHEATKAPICTAGDLADEDAEGLSLAGWGCLGLTTIPLPADDEGAAQAIVAEAGVTDHALGYRDTRITKAVGALAPGDLALCSVGREALSRVDLKEDTRIASISTKDGDDPVHITLDGAGQTIIIEGFGHSILIDKTDGISMSANDCSIEFQAGGVMLLKATQIKGDGMVLLGMGAETGAGAPQPVATGPGGTAPNVPSTSVQVML